MDQGNAKSSQSNSSQTPDSMTDKVDGDHTQMKKVKCVTTECRYLGTEQQEGHCDICFETWKIIKHWRKKKRRKSRPTDDSELDMEEYTRITEELKLLSVYMVPTKKKPRTRCDQCMKKVSTIGYTCRCDGFYCPNHRLPETHECTFDYKKHGAEELARENPKIVADKITRF